MQRDSEKIRQPDRREKILIGMILGGNLLAYQELVHHYQKLVSHIVFRMVSIPEEREDLCQEVFIKVYQNLDKFEFRCKLSTWIGKIAYNASVNFLKKKKIPVLSRSNPEGPATFNGDERGNCWEQISESLFEKPQSPDLLYETKEFTKILQKEIDQLPPHYRTVIALYHLDELSIQEISEIMNLPDGTVKSYLFRARKLLKDRLLTVYQEAELVL